MSKDNTPLVDAIDRELAGNDLSTIYLVEAAAGTGKTTLLVSRILTIVRETLTPLSRVVAITFTEKAAGDLKVKLREKLEAGASEEGEAAERYRAALQDLDAMPVSTIHSFCRELIAQRPVEAGVEPGFGVADEQTSRVLLDEAWQTWLGDQFSGECPEARPFLERGMEADGGSHTLRELFDLLNGYREDLDALHVPCSTKESVMGHVAEFRKEIEQLVDSVRLCRDARDLLAQELERVRQWYEKAAWSDLDAVTISLLNRISPNGTRRGKKENWPADVLEDVRKRLFAEYELQAEALIREITSLRAAPLIAWLKDAVRTYQQLKAERNILDFHDLLIMARDMLKKSRAARDFFKARYDYLLVDEFQDTDPLQTEIIFFLAERADDFASEWEEVTPDSVKLFIVGDPKQSIYRFRRADLDLYGRVKAKIEECGQCLSIRMNFRSEPGIIGEVNGIFASWMLGPSGERFEPHYAAMEAARTAHNGGPTTVLLAPPLPADLTQNADKIAEMEAACVAEYVRDLVTHSQMIVNREETRAVSYRDIGILYSATTHLSALENALRSRGIPYQVSGGKDLPRRTEIQALRTVLAAVDNPYDTVSVIGALRSPFFACSDEELLAHRIRGGRFDYTTPVADLPHLDRSFTLLRKLHLQSRLSLPSETLAALFEETTGLQIFALKPQGESRAANLLKVLEIARALEAGGQASFHQLVRWLDHLEEMRTGEEDSPIAESGDDVVQLMTFHKAKGLEFPVVVLYRLAQNHELRRENCIVDRNHKRVEFRLAGIETVGYGEALKDEQDRQWHETMRLLYVAMTRARDVLAVPVFWTKESSEDKQDKQWFFRLLRSRYTMEEGAIKLPEQGGCVAWDTSAYSLDVPVDERLVLETGSGSLEEEIASSRAVYAAWEKRRAAYAATLERGRAFVKPSAHDATVPERDVSVIVQSTRAKRFGTFMHRVLELTELPDGANAEEAIASAARAHGMGEAECAEARTLLQKVLESDLFARRLRTAERTWRELNFVVRLNGTLMEGAMDLVFVEKGQPVIVDFKTDRVTTETAPQRAESYRHQAGAYVKALEEITGTRVPEVLLYFVRPDAVVTLPREELFDVLL